MGSAGRDGVDQDVGSGGGEGRNAEEGVDVEEGCGRRGGFLSKWEEDGGRRPNLRRREWAARDGTGWWIRMWDRDSLGEPVRAVDQRSSFTSEITMGEASAIPVAAMEHHETMEKEEEPRLHDGDGGTKAMAMAQAAAGSSAAAATTEEDPLAKLKGAMISQGAEARVFGAQLLKRAIVIKERFTKRYRHPTLDGKLTTRRLAGEARSMIKARKLGVRTPVLFGVDVEARSLLLEFVEGTSVKDLLLLAAAPPTTEEDGGDEGDAAAIAAKKKKEKEKQELIGDLSQQIGETVAKIHDGGLVHGDLTTSNMIIRGRDGKLVMIDFGLSFNSTIAEDKAVDLYVLERAFISLHSKLGDVFGLVLAAYKKSSKNWCSVLNKFAAVRLRGRKRVMIG
ncbi:hypothetical protein CBR_g40454 [Chara braunii]|uniref:non-specific serine/threonine protein kinase n=1 Tax=Chara braunii TaxID=69332 RepID=A0A388LTU0_CHABU|nr:hypothetical protein CBR_g40454 [Chara braunii]|eukprot:GBG85727.1 hypothetical protein CBR_g40454 [Chara braunii]